MSGNKRLALPHPQGEGADGHRHAARSAHPAAAPRCGADKPWTQALDPQRLQARFGFTPAEARVATALTEGASSAEMARRFQVQQNTIRAHIKQVLAKTGTVRQVQAVSVIWRTALGA